MSWAARSSRWDRIGPIGEDAGMHRRVQGLHPSVEHLGDACDLGHLGVLDASCLEDLGCATAGDELDAEGGEGLWRSSSRPVLS